MAQAIEIPIDMLQPGDLVDVEYLVKSSNETLVGLAVHSIKQTLAADERFNYSGSRWEERTDLDSGIVYRYLIVTVEVRKTARQEALPPTQQANLLIPVIILIGLVTTAVIAYSAALAYRSYNVRRSTEAVLANPDLTPEQQVEILTAQGSQPGGIGAGLASVGSSLFVAAILIGAIYLFTRAAPRSAYREY
jgi:hypothetical protein